MSNNNNQQQGQNNNNQQSQPKDLFFKSVGDYTITRMLGSGKFGEVREAQHNTTKEKGAVKIVQRTKLKSKKDVDHINREITYMKMLRHPHVVQLKEALQTTNNIYLFMELVEGGDLIDRVTKDRYLKESTARRFFQQLIIAVRYFHLQRIAHRDLKLDNLLLDKHDNLKVADLGLANLAEDSDMMLTVVGSPHYVAPEVLRQANNGSSNNNSNKDKDSKDGANNTSTGEQPATPGATNLADKTAQKAQQAAAQAAAGPDGYDGFMADMWSCGVILYTMLSGHYPFDNPERRELFNLINKGEFRMSSKIQPSAARLINKLLVINPRERYTINDVLQDEWFMVDFDQSLLQLGSMNPQKAGTPQASTLTPSKHSGVLPSPQQSSGFSMAQSTYMMQNSTNGQSSPLINKLGEQTPETRTDLNTMTQQQQQQKNSSSSNNNNAGGSNPAERPHAMFFFLGDVDGCNNTVCEVLRRMGALFKNPEQVLTEDEQRQHRNNASASDRNLFGYCNPRASQSLQVFHIAMRGLKKADGSDAHVTSVIVMHRIGQASDFQTFAQNLFQNLGAKVSKEQPKV